MLFLRLLLLLLVLQPAPSKVCQSVSVRNHVRSLAQLRNCTVVEGHVQIVLIERATEADFNQWSFPELREITQYLLFYRVQGLRRLGHLFPSLVRIGGVKLFIDYGLVVHEMFSLQELGLSSLRDVSRGSVILTKNPSLCYVNTVTWDVIAPWDPVKNYVAKNKDPQSCPSCPHNCSQGLCWNSMECQVLKEQNDCHPLCVGGCSGPGPKNCFSCSQVIGPDGDCLEHCPPNTFKYLNRRCISEEECTSIDLPNDSRVLQPASKYVTFNGSCTDICPPGFEMDTGRGCVPCAQGKCHKWCLGMSIENIGDAQALRGCTHIQGSLEISIKTGKPDIVFQELEQNLGSIQEIESYLKIVRSHPIFSLKFLNNLSVIHGKTSAYSDAGFRDNNSFLVLENPNIQELWDWNVKTNFKIHSGKVFFHYNPKLCLQHIYQFLSVIGHKNVSDFEVGKDSNGDKFPCNATEINIQVVKKEFNMIQISVPYLKIDYNAEVLRYVVYFTRDPYKNITMFEDLDQCSDSGWKTKDISIDPNIEFSSNKTFKVDLTDLEPYTQYAFYVTTYTVNRIGAKSAVYYEKTLPSKPSELSRLDAFSNVSSEITLVWDPPEHVNGKLKEYVVTWTILKQDKTLTDRRNYCKHPANYGNNLEIYKPSPQKDERNICCNTLKSHLHQPKDGFEQLCSNYNRCPFELEKTDKDSFVSCETCFYSYLQTPVKQNIQYLVRKLNNKSYFASGEWINQKYYDNHSKVDSVFISGNLTKFTIKNLLNYRDYHISVKACRELDPQELNKNEETRCSRTDVVTVKTKKNDLADKIETLVLYKILNNTVILNWDPPLHTNGLVVAYEIEHQFSLVEHTNMITECITLEEYESNGGSFSITSLSQGSFEVRVRAITLAGKGPFSDYVHFTISDSVLSPIDILGLFLCLAVICLISLGTYIFYRNRKNPLDDILIASINPDYHYVQDEWEISKDNIELVKEIGIGSFGKVYEGILKPNNTPCAVKTVHEDSSEHTAFIFLNEASVMKSVTEAFHIVHLLGVVSTVRPPLMIMELMSRGDLKTFLRSSRDTEPPSNSMMVRIACQIGDGMTFMEAKKFVHRDLAARNCLVSSDCVVKIGDFGMTRDVYETDYYRKTNGGLLPIRWMAPESLKDGVFTSQTDVWGYGVVLWEVVTLAEQPYQGSSNEQVLQEVMTGRRLEIPQQTPEALKQIMLSCWKESPSHRRSFMQIVNSLEFYHDDEFKRVSYFYSPEAAKARRHLTDYVEMRSVEDPLLGNMAKLSRAGNVSSLLSRVKLFNRGERLSRIEEAASYE